MFAIAAFNLLNAKRAKDKIIAEKKRIEDEKKAAEKAAEEKLAAEKAAIEAAKPAGLPKDADETPVYLQNLSEVSKPVAARWSLQGSIAFQEFHWHLS